MINDIVNKQPEVVADMLMESISIEEVFDFVKTYYWGVLIVNDINSTHIFNRVVNYYGKSCNICKI